MGGNKMRRAKREHARRVAAAPPRCHVCSNEITRGDMARDADGNRVHQHCLLLIDKAKEINVTQESAQRVQEAGLWLPGQE